MKLVKILLIIVMVLPVTLMCAVPIPLPIFYLLVYGACCVPMFFPGHQKSWDWLMTNARFLLFAAPHLVLLGLAALLSHGDIQSTLANFHLKVIVFTAVLLLDLGVALVMRYCISENLVRFINQETEEFYFFSGFLWFCSLFVLLDSIPCLFELPARFAILFLIGSNILLFMMVVLFANRVYSLVHNAYLKDENIRLKEEEEQQRVRTSQLEKEAYIDPLTGAYSRRYVISNMNAMLENNERFVLVFIDLDGLKRVNDLHGHQEGDLYLQRFSTFMRVSLRQNSVFARFGGDEFLILMPDCEIEEAAQQMEKIRGNMERDRREEGGIPFSYGLIQVKEHSGLSVEQWVTAADHAMYEDKETRREEAEYNVWV